MPKIDPSVFEALAEKDPFEDSVRVRKQYYAPHLDQEYIDQLTPEQFDQLMEDKWKHGQKLYGPTSEKPANLVSSMCYDGKHSPAIDVDIPVQLIPSTTPDHYHLYFPTISLTWPQYRSLLTALADAGIVEDGYLEMCLRDRQSFLRPAGARKVPLTNPEGEVIKTAQYEQPGERSAPVVATKDPVPEPKSLATKVRDRFKKKSAPSYVGY